MQDFEYYNDGKKVKKQSPDRELAASLRNNLVLRSEKCLKLDKKEFAQLIFENLYDSFREICDALLALDGYKSYSHEASIAYLKKYKIEDSVLMQLDGLRFKRNSSKYYGKMLVEEDADEALAFHNKYFNKLLSILDKRLNETGKIY
jgi:hypothetical protein